MKNTGKVLELMLAAARPGIGSAEILRDVFIQMGFPAEQLVELSTGGRVAISVYFGSRRAARSCLKKIQRLKLTGVRISLNLLLPGDWRDRWKKDLKPFRLTSRFDVVPVWHQRHYRPTKRQPILLDTTLAFGTGLHETTRFMAGLVEGAQGRFSSFLDVGTGTGLLAVVAHHCGANEIRAVDLDPHCVAVARKNFALNGLTKAKVSLRDFAHHRTLKRFDFVAANLLTDDLIALGRKLSFCVSPGGRLAVSGISLNNLSRLKQAFRRLPFRCEKIVRGRKWAAVLYRKAKDE